MNEQKAFEDWIASVREESGGITPTRDEVWHAALAWLRSQGEAVLWQFRWYDTHPHAATSGQWSEWEEAKPRNPYTDTVLDKVREIQGYIDTGFKYVFNAMTVATQPVAPGGWKLVPMEPTPTMLSAGAEGSGEFIEHAHFVWTQMLAAAPEPSK